MAELDGQILGAIRGLRSDLNMAVNGLSTQIENVDGEVRDVKSAQAGTDQRLQLLTAKFLEFADRTARDTAVTHAQTRIVELKAQIDRDFGHHGVVRRTATGMLQAFDTGLVAEETVRQVSEQLMLQTPRYWLAPALVGLAAWAGDDPELCERAVQEAFSRSPAKTSLFFALILRRQNRRESSTRWLRHYLLAQDPTALGREFPVILECVSQGAFGPAGRELLTETLDGWRAKLLTDEAVRDAQVRRFRGEIEGLRAESSTARFPRLSAVSPQWDQLDAVLRDARAHQALLDRFQPLMTAEIQQPDRLENTVDDILDQLVRDSDAEELPLRRRLAEDESIVANQGDVVAAQQATALRSAALESTWDYLTVQSTAALDPSAVGASPAAQRVALASCREWFAQAHAGFSRDYRAAVPADVEVRFENDHAVSSGSKRFKMPRWTKSLNTPLPELEQALSRHWDTYTDIYVKSLAYDMQNQVLLLAATVAAILLVFLGVSVAFALIAALVVGGGWGVVLMQRAEAATKAQEAARTLLGRHKRDAVLQLRGAHAELSDWQHSYQAADATEAKAREFIASLATATAGAAPFEGRVVGSEQSDGSEGMGTW